MNEPIVIAVIVGLLLAVSAGVRVTLPLLAVNLLAFNHVITLSRDMAWLGSQTTLILLSVACAVETLVAFVPVAGTYLKAVSTPLAFAGGTVLMAVPLGDHNPIYQWAIAGILGGGAAAITDLGVTGARAVTAPVNAASLGIFGILWNIGELIVSLALIVVSAVCMLVGVIIGLVMLAAVIALVVYLIVRAIQHWRGPRSVSPPPFVAT